MASGSGQGCADWYAAVLLGATVAFQVSAIDALLSFNTTARGVNITNDLLRSFWLHPEISRSDILRWAASRSGGWGTEGAPRQAVHDGLREVTRGPSDGGGAARSLAS